MIVTSVISAFALFLIYAYHLRGYVLFPKALGGYQEGRKVELRLPVILFVCIVMVLIFCRLAFVWVKPLANDEIEHLHSAWLVSKGLVPFRDFFQHHPPFFWWVLALPLFFFKHISVFAYAGGAKIFICLQALAILLVLSLISKEVYGRRLSGIITFLVMMLSGWGYTNDALFEIRPDIPMLLLFFGALYCVVKYLAEQERLFYFYLGVGLAVFSQFVLPKLPVSFCFLIGYAATAMVIKHGIVKGGGLSLLALLTATAVFLLMTVWQINLSDFFNFVFRSNLYVDSYLEERFSLSYASQYIPVLFFSGAGGILSFYGRKKNVFDPINLILLVSLGGISELLFLYPHLVPQYYLFLYLCLGLLSGGVVLLKEVDYRMLDFMLLVILVFLAFNMPEYSKYASYKKMQDTSIAKLLQATDKDDRVFLDPTFHPIFRYDSSYYWFSRYRVLPGLMANIDRLDFLPFKDELFDVRVPLRKRPPKYINTPESFCWNAQDKLFLQQMDPEKFKPVSLGYLYIIGTAENELGVAEFMP